MRNVILIGMAAAWAAAAQTPPASRVGVSIAERRLTLAQAVETALKNNLEIEIERANTAYAQAAIRAARGAFDSFVRWQPLIESRNTPASSILFGADGKLAERFHSQNFYFLQKLPWKGTSIHLDFENSRQSTSNPFVSLNPYLTSRLVFGFAHPLLRNREIDQDRAQIRIRSKQREVSEVDLELRAIDVINRAEQAYWDLVAARQDAKVKEDNVEWARQQLARNRRFVENGTLAPVELSAAEAELERRLDDWYASIGAVTEVENVLKILLAADRSDSLWGDEIVPVEETTAEAPAGDLRAAVTQALKQRPELRHLALRRDINAVQKELSANQTKPQLNLIANYSNAGLAGAVGLTDNPFSASTRLSSERLNELSRLAGLPPLPTTNFGGATPESLIGGYGSALSGLFGGRYQSVQVGLSLDWSPQNRTAEATQTQTAIDERRLKLELARTEQVIEAQVRNALQSIQTARQRITAAESSARAAKEKLDSEERLFQNGESTNFLVLTRQNEYSDSRRRAVAARLDLNKAIARLRQAQGSTLPAYNIRIQ